MTAITAMAQRHPFAPRSTTLLRENGVDAPVARVELFCMPRTFGYVFNPLSIYFCRRQDGSLAAIVYQVHNTFGERHSYVIPVEESGQVVRQQCQKVFYVSPFMDVDLRYDFRVSQPGDDISVAIRARAGRQTRHGSGAHRTSSRLQRRNIAESPSDDG